MFFTSLVFTLIGHVTVFNPTDTSCFHVPFDFRLSLELIPQNQVGHLLFLFHNVILYTTLYYIYANFLGTFLNRVGKSEWETVVQGKELNTGLSTEVHWLGFSTVLKTVSFQWCNDQCHVKYVKITGVDYTSNDAGSRPTYYLLFPLCFLSSLIYYFKL